nr:fimbria/pilus outer membrane usher protein [Acinetobacter courvalinii]
MVPVQAFAAEEYTEFDTGALTARGLDPKVAEQFREAPRFLTGESTVSLTVNGKARGKVKAKFGQEGQLCATNALIKQSGLVTPSEYKEEAECFDLKTAWEQTEITLDPNDARVDIVLPADAINDSESQGNWTHGGFAGVLNYNAQYMTSTGAAAGLDFMQLGTEAGFNLGDWIVRSRQTFSQLNGENSVRHQAAYAQRTFTPIKKVLQAGQISLSNSMFGTGQVLGFQMFPETALQNDTKGPALVEGIADTQSVVEVRQSGVLVHSTTVPAGRFRLQGFQLLNTRSDLVVTVLSNDGSKREFIVPASALLQSGSSVVPGVSFGMGKLDQQGSGESPFVATIANGWQLTPRTSLNAGVLGSTPWQAGAVSVNSQIFDATQLSLQSTFAQDKEHNNKGVSNSMSLSHSLTERISVSFNASQQSEGYRELSDALQENERENTGHIRNQLGGGIGWSAEKLGSFSMSWARSNTFDNDSVNYIRGSWSKQIAGAYVSASLDHNTGGKNTEADNRFYLTLSVPLGRSRSTSAYFNDSSRGSRAGARFNDRTNPDRSWSVSADHDLDSQRSSVSASMNLNTPISQLSGSVSTDSGNYTTWSAQASGAIVSHNKGIAMSPYRVGDTFGIARVGDVKGVRLDTPAGPTWTNGRGYAVIPSLSSYKRSSIQVDTRSLAKNVDIANAWQETEAARGSVNYVEFDVVRTRRVLADVKDADNKPLPHGASVFDKAGNFVTVVGKNGSVFIPDAGISGKMDVQVSGKTMCSFALEMPEKADDSALYETAYAVCESKDNL